ncbi:hypothetical protein PPERSA_03642 [Pseudocohnilembus persalinus]|uniref:Uncharacterized protein n=1 Tax=Pseudocohnilembus persalinus TaxID=266149 RepID=A0A0V0QE13_PSEPJ|nr:hypothetical protein PPERSA_03642 [Pseudocohnilembus persalinus]|eukprot:KRX00421.1 hypothetical protein PPERSA_03642 [Pseudocohnilembus persalinus]
MELTLSALMGEKLEEIQKKQLLQLLAQFENLEKLKIDLSLNPIEQEGATNLCTGIKGLQNLKSLKLEFSECFIVGSVNKLFQELQELKNLKEFEIDLRGNKLDEKEQIFVDQFKDLKELKKIDIPTTYRELK